MYLSFLGYANIDNFKEVNITIQALVILNFITWVIAFSVLVPVFIQWAGEPWQDEPLLDDVIVKNQNKSNDKS